MEIKKLLEIESIISGRKTPSDMNDDALNAHYSKSRGEEIKILEMHLPHLVRAYSNMLIYDKEWNDKSYNEGWNDALESLKK
jgi:hypothetical protein